MNVWTFGHPDFRDDHLYSPSTAARVTGIGLRTIYNWMKIGKLVSCTGSNRFYGRRLREAAEGRFLPPINEGRNNGEN